MPMLALRRRPGHTPAHALRLPTDRDLVMRVDADAR